MTKLAHALLTSLVLVTTAACAPSLDAFNPAPPFPVSPFDKDAPRIHPDAIPGTALWWQRTAAKLSDDYRSRYIALVQTRPWLDFPLIGLAAGAIGALFYGAHPDTVFGVGLGAGTLGATRAYLNFSPAADAYLAGSSAALCVVREAGPIVAVARGDGTLPADLLQAELAEVRESITAAERSGLLTKPIPTEPDSDAIRRFIETQVALRSSAQAAQDAIRVSQNELDALSRAHDVMFTTTVEIANKVAKRVAFQASDFASLQTTILQALTAASDNQSALEQVRSALRGKVTQEPAEEAMAPGIAGDIASMRFLMEKLASDTLALTMRTPQILNARAALLQCATAL